MEHLLCNAIAVRKRVAFTYNGCRLIVDPYVLGYSVDGDIMLLAWDAAEVSWRLFCCLEIVGPKLVDQDFETPGLGFPFGLITRPLCLCEMLLC